ncbi:hypothetical protein JKP75_00690 [Blastococcus sp. TML/M2B]|uniref:hypothetical protein n=1 Tax=unclassified Blastococcus TaxID=2619396 RepID=UPI00190BB9D3|nr:MULTISPECIES: hypothetical protein [unclassified Blastococcus]MBN1091240.1 hypothetical protein [Blastococcus sp. TML/M2B]MBN1095204.1 hypothetical protein [Blastococcus sp. TML/C7B]
MTVPTVTPAGEYRAPHWHDALLLSLPDRLISPHTRRWIERVPLVAVVVVFTALALRLRNGASADEALAINSGRDLISSWVTQTAVTGNGEALSGARYLYPFLAATLDSVGGLFLVRAFGLACAVAAILLVSGAVAPRYSHRAGVFAATAFALSAPVVFVAALGTADAVALACLAAALWCLAARGSAATALVAGGLLTLASLLEYSTAVLVPVVLVAGAALSGVGALRRAGYAAGTTVLLTAFAYVVGAGPGARAWTDFLGDEPLSPQSWTGSLGWLVLDIGVLSALAVLGAVRLAGAGGRDALVAASLLVGSASFPAAQLWTGEAGTFDRNLAYSALFLAPLAGIALTRMSRGPWRLGPVLLILPVLVLFGVSRSGVIHGNWPDVRPVAAAILEDPGPGLYLASGPAAEALEYSTNDLPAVQWEDTYGLYAQGEDAVRVAVEDLRYETIVLHSAETGSPAEDAMEDVVLTALHDNYTDYELVASIPASGVADADVWLVYRQVSR